MNQTNIIQNQETAVPKTSQMNDRDYLNDILETEKNMSTNMAIALNEASNEKLYDELFDIFKDIKNMQRSLYECMFRKGWYTLEKAEDMKINEKYNIFREEFNDLTI